VPKVQLPYAFKTKDENANRRQDSEDKFFGELTDPPREFNGDGVEIVCDGLLDNARVRLNHKLGFQANGWLVKRVTLPTGRAVCPRMPTHRSDFVNDASTLELLVSDAGDYTFLVF
jgi:hypothetical protein